MFLTVFTPTYNRAYILPALYQSLRGQGRVDFEWIVVDDGSTDGTRDLVTGWADEAEFDIRYIYQERGGKARAHNKAVTAARAPFFVVIDSDDVVAEGGIDLIYDNLHHLDSPEILYLLFPCQLLKGGRVTAFPESGTVLSWRQFVSEFPPCETTPVYKTSVWRQYLYPEFPGELYVSPSYLLNLISDRYSGYVVNTPLRLIEYLPDGITNNRNAVKCGNYKGWALVKNQDLGYASGFRSLFKSAGVYDAYAILAGKRKFISSSSRPLWALMALPAGVWYMMAVILRGKYFCHR